MAMPNIASALRAKVARPGREEVHREGEGSRKAVVFQGAEIATLKRRAKGQN